MNIRKYKTVSDRRAALEKNLRVRLTHIGSYTLDETVAATRNCENMIGVSQIPLGVAGPVHGKYIPLATTEGALVASVNRGCKAITEAGGASVLASRVGATRGPVFKVKDMVENSKLYDFILSHKAAFGEIARTTSNHIALTNVETVSVGLYRFVRFTFDTGDAMGMNMVTIATNAITAFIQKKTGIACLSLAGNFDVDKKPSWVNVTRGRGFEVWAEAVIPQHTLRDVLKTTAQKVYEVWLAKCMVGSAISGSMGYNAQYANIIAALFIATGQDPAHVAEGSMGVTTAEVRNKDLYISVFLPDVMIGTVGGGTGLATQKEALSLLGVKHSSELTEIIGVAVLAGELSLLSSLSEGTLAHAHKTLARGGTQW